MSEVCGGDQSSPQYLTDLEEALADRGEKLQRGGQEGWTVAEVNDVYDIDAGSIHDQKLRVVGDLSFSGKEFYLQPEHARGLIRVNVDHGTRTAYLKSDIGTGADPLYWAVGEVLSEYGIEVDDRGL